MASSSSGISIPTPVLESQSPLQKRFRSWSHRSLMNLLSSEKPQCPLSSTSSLCLEKLKEWLALGGEGDEAPKILIARPVTAMPFEGTRNRRIAAMGEYTWYRVNAWMQNSWWEGVVMEKSRKMKQCLPSNSQLKESHQLLELGISDHLSFGRMGNGLNGPVQQGTTILLMRLIVIGNNLG